MTTIDNQLIVVASSNFSYLTSATPTVLSYSIGGSFGQPLQVFGNLVSARSLRLYPCSGSKCLQRCRM